MNMDMYAAPRTEGLRALVVDDDDVTRRLVARSLSTHGYTVIEAADGLQAIAALSARPDVVVLDVMLPELDGLGVLTTVRRDSEVPVILLTGRSGEADRIQGLDLGADDYVVKPFSPAELAARVRTVLRRSRGAGPPARLEFPPLSIDPGPREVGLDGEPIHLTRIEFDLLAFLAANPGRAFRRGQLLERVWGSSAAWQDQTTVTEHVRRIRQKLEPDPTNPAWVRTVRGSGYLFDPEGGRARTG